MKTGLKILIIAVMAAVILALGLALVGFADNGAEPAVQDSAVSSEVSSTDTEIPEDEDESSGLSFSTTALDGSAVDESIFEGKSLIMLNFWESWCGPCVSEMPDLQRISEEYADKGFLIVGVYSTERDTQKVVDSLGINYPIIKNCEAFDQFVTGYVPTTAFVDGEGNILSELIVGGRSYEDWKEIIDSLMA